LKPVDLQEFRGLRVRGAGHSRELPVEAEVVLEGDRGDRLVLLAYPDTLLRLHRLMQTIRPAAPGHRAAPELVNDYALAASHDVFNIALLKGVRALRGIEVMHQTDVGRVVQALTFTQQARLDHQLLDVFVTRLGEVNLLALLLDREIAGPFLLHLAC